MIFVKRTYYPEQDIVDTGPALFRHCEEPFCGDEAIPSFFCTLSEIASSPQNGSSQ
jgi:hypothetical protein